MIIRTLYFSIVLSRVAFICHFSAVMAAEAIAFPMWATKKVRLREIKWLTPGHRAGSKQQSQEGDSLSWGQSEMTFHF